MKNLEPAYAAHIATGATSLCYCWLVERTDGVKLGFTDHDVSLTFDGHTFIPANGFEGGEIAAKLGSQVDASEVLGVLSSDAISEDDITLGRYDGARVTTLRVNWRDTDVRDTQRVDTIGEIVREDGLFRAELRSQQQSLNIASGRRYQSLCDANVGDGRCGVDLNTAAYRTTGTVDAIINRFSIEVSGLSAFAAGWFSFGTAVWDTGKRANLIDTIGDHKISGAAHVLEFADPVGDWLEIGDQATFNAGCDRRASVCQVKFGNIINFRGFPHIPGSDAILKYPRSEDDYSGEALIK